MSRECVICSVIESEAAPLHELPCLTHWVCHDCIGTYFEKATSDESLYPPTCCGQQIPLDRFQDLVPQDVKQAFLEKAQGEYTVPPIQRIYCAAPTCGEFIHPDFQITNRDSSVKYGVCDAAGCSQVTCCACRTLLPDNFQNHLCQDDDSETQFKQMAFENGYKQCAACGATVELAYACNHITCRCGNDFCYACGREWPCTRGCPAFGPVIYDVEGYNQYGYHRDTGLSRDGRTYEQEQRQWVDWVNNDLQWIRGGDGGVGDGQGQENEGASFG